MIIIVPVNGPKIRLGMSKLFILYRQCLLGIYFIFLSVKISKKLVDINRWYNTSSRRTSYFSVLKVVLV